MNILVYDQSFVCVGVVDIYESLIWTEKLNEFGDFELYVPANKDYIDLLKMERYLMKSDSQTIMIIESLATDITTDGDIFLIVSGRSIESILTRRIVWNKTTIIKSLVSAFNDIFNANIISPSNADRKLFVNASDFQYRTDYNTPLTDFQESDDFKIRSLSVNFTLLGTDIYDLVSKTCKLYGIGFRIFLNSSNQLIFTFYSGLNKSYEQDVNPYVVFSKKYDNLLTTNYTDNREAIKNVALICGEEDQVIKHEDETETLYPQKFTTVGNSSLLNRRELYVDGSGTSQNLNDEEKKLSDAQYYAVLQQEGFNELASRADTIDIDADVEYSTSFIPNKDYYLGDSVQIIDDYFINGRALITEMSYTYDSEGESVNPVLDVINYYNKLPEEYTELIYIKSTGEGQYIDTHILPANFDSVEIEFMLESSGLPDTEVDLCSSYDDESNKVQCGYNRVAPHYLNTAGGFGYTVDRASADRYNSWIRAYGTKIGEPTFSMLLFGQHEKTAEGAVVVKYTGGNKSIKRVTFYGSDGNIVGDFIPCYRKSDGVIGMFNKFNNTFEVNAGSGSFVKGPEA